MTSGSTTETCLHRSGRLAVSRSRTLSSAPDDREERPGSGSTAGGLGLRHAVGVAHPKGSRLPPLRYWRARTPQEKQEAYRSGIIPGLVAVPVLLIVVVAVGSVVTDPPTWLIWVTTVLVIVPFGFWGELRSARKRQRRHSATD